MKKIILLATLFATITFGQSNWFFYWAGDDADITPPATPQNLLATGGVGEIVLTWDANTDDDLSRYVLYEYSSDDSSSSSAVDSCYAGVETITRSGLTAGTIYFYWLLAVDSNQNRGFYSDVASDTAEYILLAENYKDRVIADGGSVINMAAVDSAITNAQDSTYYDSTKIWISADFGVKKDANNKVTKLYNIKGTNDFSQADTSKAGTWFASGGADSRPYIYFGIVAAFNDYMDATSAVNIASVHTVFDPTTATSAEESYEAFVGGVGTRLLLRAEQNTTILNSGSELFAGGEYTANLKVNNSVTLSFTNDTYQLFDIYGTSASWVGRLAWDNTGGNPATMKFQEMIMTNITTKQNAMRTYLNSKYSIY